MDRVKDLAQLQAIVAQAHETDKRVVWTNGCFDILHAGHVAYLEKAAAEGDMLVVGVNSDASVREVKGPDRPVVPEGDRARIVAALRCVDYVIVFSDASAEPILDALRPDVYVKGGDYTVDTIHQGERRLVEGYGGRVAIVAGVEGKSTTDIVARISGK